MGKVSGRRARRLVGAVACALAAGAMTAGSASAVTWETSLNGREQTASGVAGDPDGTGYATVTASYSGAAGGRLCATVSFSNIAQPVVAAHIHEGGAGQPENPAWTINLFGPNVGGTSSPASGCTIVTKPQIDAMVRAPMLFNVVVHNQQYPAGAIRGQFSNAALCHAIDEALCAGAVQ